VNHNVFWESNPTNIKSPSGECFAGDGNTLATGGEGIFMRGEELAKGGGKIARGGNGLAGGGGRIAEGGGRIAEGGGRIAEGGGVLPRRAGSARRSLYLPAAKRRVIYWRTFGIFVLASNWKAAVLLAAMTGSVAYQ